MKKCTKCGIKKELVEFYKNSQQKSGLNPSCIDCKKKTYRKYKKLNGEAILAYGAKRRKTVEYKDYHLNRLYGITTVEYQKIFTKQKGLCAICGLPETKQWKNSKTMRLHIDHDHNIGIVRGLLCNKCNPALGAFDDNIDILASAISYLNQKIANAGLGRAPRN